MAITTQQRAVTNMTVGYAGDAYGSFIINQALVQGRTVTGGGITVGTFCWGISGTNNIAQIKGANTQLAGFVIRAQNTPMPWDAVLTGASARISDGLTANFVAEGTFLCNVTSLNAGGDILPNDGVYTRDVDGVTCVSTADAGAGYTNTGWIVTKTNVAPVSAGQIIVVISNEQTFN